MKNEKTVYSAETIFGKYIAGKIRSGKREPDKDEKRQRQLYRTIEDYIEQA